MVLGMRVTLKAVNEELVKLGHAAQLVKASSYFYFEGGEAEDWLDKISSVETISSLTLPEWMAEFERLKKLNGEIMSKRTKRARKQKGSTR
jgi:hypothetical protein